MALFYLKIKPWFLWRHMIEHMGFRPIFDELQQNWELKQSQIAENLNTEGFLIYIYIYIARGDFVILDLIQRRL